MRIWNWRVQAIGREGVVLRRGRATHCVPYSEILTTEHRPGPRGLRLHLRGDLAPLRVNCGSRERARVEGELRAAGIRIVDEYGAMMNPTLDEFLRELAREPRRLRQSSDNG